MSKFNSEEWAIKMEAEKVAIKERITKVLDNEELLDEDGYPSEAALEIISIWHWTDEVGWFEFINSLWHLKSWGWSEGLVKSDFSEDLVYRYNISTAGWSGNESIIAAMKDNDMLWHFTWVQSRRGGHYIFERRNTDGL